MVALALRNHRLVGHLRISAQWVPAETKIVLRDIRSLYFATLTITRAACEEER